MEIFTIGFTQKTAGEFFGALKQSGITRLIDIRLNNSSQLAGFTKRDDLSYFLHEICGAAYVHEPLLAPTADILDAYKKKEISWEQYEDRFRALLALRAADQKISREHFDGRTVLLCSEPKPEKCHRRLVAEYLKEKWGDVEVKHL